MAERQEPKQQHQQQQGNDVSSPLLDRLYSYAVVNSLYQSYDAIKNYNSVLKTTLDMAEVSLKISKDLSSPVIAKLDESLGLEDKAVKLLDRVENTYNTALHMKDDAVDKTKNLATTTASVVYDPVGSVHMALDKAESALDQILPPVKGEDQPKKEGEQAEKPNIVSRAVGLGITLPTRAYTVVMNLEKGKFHVDLFSYTLDLVQASVDYIPGLTHERFDEIKKNLSESQTVLKDRFYHVAEEASKKILNFRQIIDDQLTDVSRLSVKLIISVVSPLAQATELIRRQILGEVPSLEDIQSSLITIIGNTKKAILAMQKKDLHEYILQFKKTTLSTITSFIDIVIQYAPIGWISKVPGVDADLLSSWKDSLLLRLGNVEEELEKQGRIFEVEERAINESTTERQTSQNRPENQSNEPASEVQRNQREQRKVKRDEKAQKADKEQNQRDDRPHGEHSQRDDRPHGEHSQGTESNE